MPAEMGLAKTHFLENCDLPTLLEPAPAHAVQVMRASTAQHMLTLARLVQQKHCAIECAQ